MSTYCESVLSDLSDSSDLSETSSAISTNLKVEMTNIELKEGKLYATHDDFITAIKDYAKSLGFSIRLGKVDKNSSGKICKRTILCSREGNSKKFSKSSN